MIFLIAFVLMVGAFYIYTRQEDKLRKQEISQLEILQIRYDRGEISRQEYLYLLKHLQ